MFLGLVYFVFSIEGFCRFCFRFRDFGLWGLGFSSLGKDGFWVGLSFGWFGGYVGLYFYRIASWVSRSWMVSGFCWWRGGRCF